MRLLGYDNTRNYDGSMGEWANRDDTPLEMPG
jgi:3-mercaptopyruvate sulfurtransferase SseA